MKTLLATVIGTGSLLNSGLTLAQSGNMMDGGAWMGGYGAMWVPILLVVVVAGLVAWIVGQNRK